MENTEYGIIRIKVKDLIEYRKISKTLLSYRSEISRTQLNRLLNEEAVGINFHTLAKLCCVLDCRVEDILEYMPDQISGSCKQ